MPHCLRRVDSNVHYPESLRGEVHADGRISSRALWDIRGALGHVKADTVILDAQFSFPGSSMADLARRTVAAAQAIHGSREAAAAQRAFTDRGIP